MAKSKFAAGGVLNRTRDCCLFGLLSFAALQTALAQAVPAAPEPPPSTAAVAAPTISYVGGQLTIDAHDANLAVLLAKVAALTGVSIDIPSGANTEVISVVRLGPAPARQVLASLLGDAHFDYLIQAADADPEKIQSVLILPRNKKGLDSVQIDASARPSGNSYPRGRAPVPEPAESTLEPESPTVQASAALPLRDQPPGLPVSPLEQSTPMRSAPLSPPQSLTPQTINTQLQLMYQQRMQMTQQSKQSVSAAAQP